MSRHYKRYVEWCKENGYDYEKVTTWIAYIDATSLYSHVMMKSLPVDDYRKESFTMEDMFTALDEYKDDDPRGFFF